jgi:hypothetical protein
MNKAQVQYSTSEQIQELRVILQKQGFDPDDLSSFELGIAIYLANTNGLYDAADHISVVGRVSW